jgi:hypothetical protein
MASTWQDVSTEQLEALLASAGPAVDLPDVSEGPDVAALVVARLRSEPAHRREGAWARVREWLAGTRREVLRPTFRSAWPRVAVAAALVVAILSGTMVFSPGVRRAVAGWLGLRGVKIESVPSGTPTPTGTPSLALGAGLDLGQPVTLAEAQAAVPFRIMVPTDPALGEPDEVYLRHGNIADQVTLLYRERPGLPKAALTGAALLLTEFQARIDEEFVLHKTVHLGATVERATVNGEPGFWISGQPHEVGYFDPDGDGLFDRIRLAGNVLLWQHGEVTLRIEADIARDEAIRFASSVR